MVDELRFEDEFFETSSGEKMLRKLVIRLRDKEAKLDGRMLENLKKMLNSEKKQEARIVLKRYIFQPSWKDVSRENWEKYVDQISEKINSYTKFM